MNNPASNFGATPAGGVYEGEPHGLTAKKPTCGHPKCDLRSESPNRYRCSGFCEESADNSFPQRIEDILSPEQQQKLHADLKEMANQRRKAQDSIRDWPLP